MFSSNCLFRHIFPGIFFLLFIGTTMVAQHYPVRTYTEADGLANSMIYDLKQDSSGIIWIARRSGISSYDGITFRNYNVTNGLSPTSYAFLRIDSKNKLWALVESGQLMVSTYDGQKFSTITGSFPRLVHPFYTFTSFEILYEGNDPILLVGSENEGLFRYQRGLWTHFGTSEGLPGNNVNAIAKFEGKVYLATEKGLSFFTGGLINKKIMGISPYLSGNIIAMAPEGNVLWLAGENWLGFLKQGKFTLATTDFVLSLERNGRKCFMQSDGMGKLYFGNLMKVYCYNLSRGTIESLTRANGLISEGGSSVLIDREYNIWIGGFRGITKILSRRFASYYKYNGLHSDEVASGLEYAPGRYLFGHDGALTYYDGKTFTPFLLDPALKDPGNECRILDMTKDAAGDVWVAATTLGIARINKNKTVRWYSKSRGLQGFSFSVLCTSGGKTYAATSEGLFEMKGEKFERILYQETHGASIRKIYPGKGNSIFLSTITWGLIEITDGIARTYQSRDNPLANNVFSFLLDSRNRKWVGTAAGLYEVRDSALQRNCKAPFSITRPIYLILEDPAGNLWFGCDNGVYRWNGTKLDHFSTAEGLSGLEINRSAGFIDSRDRIWFGTNNGLTVYDPDFDYKQKEVPAPILSLLYVEAGNDTLSLGNQLEFSHDLNNPVFHFKAISLIDEKQVVYKYMLEGLDTTWSGETFYQNNSVRYNNLKPGKYRFCVKARNSLGIWCAPVYSSRIIVRQPFWFRWWFLLFAVIIVAGIGIMAGRFILIARYNTRLEATVSERTRELELSQQKLQDSNAAKDNFFSIIAHDLKSPFNVILGMLDLLTTEYSEYSDEERQMMLKRLKSASTRTIDLLENLLTWARAQRGLLPYSPEKIDLLDVIHENVLLFESALLSKDILLTQTGEKEMMVMADLNMITTIVRNLISNAIKFTFPGGSITINVSSRNSEEALVSVKDTGFGMSPETLDNLFKIEKRMVARGTNNEMGTGLGLILSKDFIVKNNGKIWVNSEEGSGSCFYFSLPLYNPES
ncbi:MAG: ATP-binding protein [Bacteroidota bacterium]